jgi:aspartate aminotransferase
MFLSRRVTSTKTSTTLQVNEKIQKLILEGKQVYNMTGGQLPVKPPFSFIESLKLQLNFLKSYQYSSVAGLEELRLKLKKNVLQKRFLELNDEDQKFGVSIANGSKHSLYNLLGCLIDPGDEVVLIAPYWVSYPEMVKFWGGTSVIVESQLFDSYVPHLEEIEKAISSRTKAIIINSPNNPAGIYYSEQWMRDFCDVIKKFPDLAVISDEVYFDLSYYDPSPSYFYQFDHSLLERTFIVGSISKSLASAGLRLGYCLGPEKFISAMTALQSQTTSGASSLVQRALCDFDLEELPSYLEPIKKNFRQLSEILREVFRDHGLAHCWYQTNSAFFFLIDFSRVPLFPFLSKKFSHQIEGSQSNDNNQQVDISVEICDFILLQTGVALVPGQAFGYPNAARLSLTLEPIPFQEGLTKLIQFLARSSSN